MIVTAQVVYRSGEKRNFIVDDNIPVIELAKLISCEGREQVKDVEIDYGNRKPSYHQDS